MAEHQVASFEQNLFDQKKELQLKFFNFTFFHIKRVYRLFIRKLFFKKAKRFSKKFNSLFKQVLTHFTYIVKFKKNRVKKFNYFKKLKVKYHFNSQFITRLLIQHLKNKIYNYYFPTVCFNMSFLCNFKKKINFNI
jgi:hypothetical protein